MIRLRLFSAFVFVVVAKSGTPQKWCTCLSMKRHKRDALSYCIIPGVHDIGCIIIGKGNYYHFVKVMSPGASTCKLTIFPFVVTKHLPRSDEIGCIQSDRPVCRQLLSVL